MPIQQSEWMWLDERDAVTVNELSQVSGFGPAEVDELVEYGALPPLPVDRQERLFSAQCITQLRTASKLRLDFDLDLFTVAMLLGYLNRIEALERQVRGLQAHLPSSS
jgi:chaperone modulatory protein CbpM